MGAFGLFLFGEKDVVLVEEIAKLHKLDKEKVAVEYKKMLDALKGE